MTKKIIFTSLTALIFSSFISGKFFQEKKIIEREAAKFLKNEKVKSVSIGVVHKSHDYIVHEGELTNGELPSDNTLYEIGSLSKTMTGYLLAREIDQGNISLDQDVRDFLKGSYPNLVYEDQPIQIKHLVVHTSGLPLMYPYKPDLIASSNWHITAPKLNLLQQGFRKEQFLERLGKEKLSFKPGTGFNYSNVGTNLLGIILENVSGKDFNTLIEYFIFNPLEMQDSFIVVPEKRKDDVAVGIRDGHKMPLRATKEINAEGGIISNMPDMMKYMRYQLNSNDPVVSLTREKLLTDGSGNLGYGFFWQIEEKKDGTTRITQDGGTYGTSCYMILIPKLEIGIFIITNAGGKGIHQSLKTTAEAIIDEIK